MIGWKFQIILNVQVIKIWPDWHTLTLIDTNIVPL